MRYVLVSHFHWDREWYRSFEAYRGRLVDAVDRVLELLERDRGYRFVLDGQAVLLEDYLAVRPDRRDALVRGLESRRLGAGPWYVQPDLLLPSGEALVRNLLLGRRVMASLGPCSTVGYVPDSFGHPAQLPQLLRGFGLESFVYWRGNGDEIDALGSAYTWVAPDGSHVTALLLREGYFAAAGLPDDPDAAARHLAALAARLGGSDDAPAVLMNGFDHQLPDGHTAAVVRALGATGTVVRGLLEDAVAAVRPEGVHSGALLGGRIANLLPGVWSTRMPIKLRNREVETMLEAWVEPWAALGRVFGTPDERPSLQAAWRSVVQNQAHDSICGCALDHVAVQVLARYDAAAGLAEATLGRLLERLSGQGAERRVPWTEAQAVAVFNPSPHPVTDVVRVPLEPYPAMRMQAGIPEFPPLLLAASGRPGFVADGQPVRVVPSDDPSRARWLPAQQPVDVELIARDVPAFGWRRIELTPAPPAPDEVDDERDISVPSVSAHVTDDGTLMAGFGGRWYHGLAAVEDRGDRGDTYDFDPVADDVGATLRRVSWRRIMHPSGISRLEVTRVFAVPRALDAARERRADETVDLTVTTEVRIAAGVDRIDLTVRIDNTADDHRLRLLFPTKRGLFRAFDERCLAATTFDVTERGTTRPDDARWLHPAPATFPHQGWVGANQLVVLAPGLPEAEVMPDGTIAITLVRSVGCLARYDLWSRTVPAGPPMPTDGAQVRGPLVACLSLSYAADAPAVRAAQVGLRGVLAGPEPILYPDTPLLRLEPRTLVLSAVKPAEDGDGIVVRVLNPTDSVTRATLHAGFPVAAALPIRLDETPARLRVATDGARITFDVPAHALRTVLVHPDRRLEGAMEEPR